MIMKFTNKYILTCLSLMTASLLLISAYLLEFYLNLIPCELCVQQRIIHFIIILISIISIFFIKFLKIYKFLNTSLILLWLSSSILAFYHFGIEKKIWLGFSSCSSKINFNENTLNKILSTKTLSCDNTHFEILNISLAGWNGLVSMSLFTISILLLYLYNKGIKYYEK